MPRPSRAGLLVCLLPLVLLTGCGDDGDPAISPTAPAVTASAPTTSAPAPTPAGPDRSPGALKQLLTFSSPAGQPPAVQRAIDDYEAFIREQLVAQGLSDPGYAPLRARVDASVLAAVVSSIVQNKKVGSFLAGPYTEHVLTAAGDARQVVLRTCGDLSKRVVYDSRTGKRLRASRTHAVDLTVTMTRGADGYVLLSALPSAAASCP